MNGELKQEVLNNATGYHTPQTGDNPGNHMRTAFVYLHHYGLLFFSGLDGQ